MREDVLAVLFQSYLRYHFVISIRNKLAFNSHGWHSRRNPFTSIDEAGEEFEKCVTKLNGVTQLGLHIHPRAHHTFTFPARLRQILRYAHIRPLPYLIKDRAYVQYVCTYA